MKLTIRFLLVMACSLFCFRTGLHAQESTVSGIVGQVTDATHAAVAGAVIHVINVDTNAERTTESGPGGDYSVPNLQPARYKVTVEKPGFSTAVV